MQSSWLIIIIIIILPLIQSSHNARQHRLSLKSKVRFACLHSSQRRFSLVLRSAESDRTYHIYMYADRLRSVECTAPVRTFLEVCSRQITTFLYLFDRLTRSIATGEDSRSNVCLTFTGKMKLKVLPHRIRAVHCVASRCGAARCCTFRKATLRIRCMWTRILRLFLYRYRIEADIWRRAREYGGDVGRWLDEEDAAAGGSERWRQEDGRETAVVARDGLHTQRSRILCGTRQRLALSLSLLQERRR